MQYRELKNVGIVSALGFGAMRLPKKNDNIDETEATQIIRHAIDSGVNYIDTAYFYHDGKSETFLGKALGDGYREKVILTTKSPLGIVKTAADFDRVFDEQLKKLNTSYIDCYFFHALSREKWDNIVIKEKLIPRMHKLRDEGKIKHIGFSFHDNLETFKHIIDTFEGCELCQIQLNYIDVNNQAGIEGLEYAAAHGLGVVIMEPLLGGKLANVTLDVAEALGNEKTLVEAALDFLWNRREVSLVLSGMSNAAQVEQNIIYAGRSGIGMLSDAELERYKAAKKCYDSKMPVSCTGCSYCMPCPQGINIPTVFDTFNRGAQKPFFAARDLYNKLLMRADRCVACQQCEDKCPQQLPISKLMKNINEMYGN